MTTKSKMAYLMHVDWNWIKQRPQFLYEELTRYYTVDLFYIHKLYGNETGGNQNVRNVYSDSKVRKLGKLPLSGKISGLRGIERIINRSANQSLEQYEYIWITSPLLLDFFSLDQLENKIVIYDCMDDFLGFYSGTSGYDRLRELEIRLVARADQIITSSEYLKNKIETSYGECLNREPVVINNGISSTLFIEKKSGCSKLEKINSNPKLINLMYIGTIGSWMDFHLILRVLDEFNECMFTMVGPVETKVPTHPRIKYVGTVKHDQLFDYAQQADALVMPFVLNELVRSVDPVKIYEYIFFNKPILAIDYAEMNKFKPFVRLYSGEKDFINLISELKDNKFTSYSQSDVIKFLRNNTWEHRCKHIISTLEGVRR